MKRAAWVLAGALGAVRAAAAPSVELVEPGAYVDTAVREIDGAKKSVVVGMYLFRVAGGRGDAPATQLAEALARAQKRGVAVEVILDRGHEGGDPAEGGPEGKNGAAYRYLRERGVAARYDDLATVTHAKALVVDEETAVVGSSNWTAAALTRNREADLLVRDPKVARELAARLRAVPGEAPPTEETGLRLGEEFLLNKSLMGRMITTGDARALKAALFLFHKAGGRGAWTMDEAELGRALGLDGQTPTARRRQIRKTLAKLERRYGRARQGPEPGTVTVTPTTGTAVDVPEDFWAHGWDRRLSLAGTCAYLISRREAARSILGPRWSVSMEELAERYGASAWFLSKGMTELHRYDLMEVDRAPLGPEGPERPSVYAPGALYDFDARERALAELTAQHGPEKTARARRAAALVYEDWDVAGVAELIRLEDRYGRAGVDAALKELGKKLPVNPKRSMAYLIGTARRMGEGQ
ncbi:MAG: hypothetical protein IPO76_02830 [Elusimicrobia bacterium]|nr:hypothetical protein [Elusimicrobiota bacterium]MBL0250483.1 hypothetical protein [Elusimicrobiota bacterium]